ncbi:LysR family transcriptional regulator [Pseudomonas sp. NPDC089996]|uniref:LysR family transcriptional regulator n=1 Tax=Pseudomonas sp. NPDC089996 TaxID=3364474 RepID=UPI00380F6D38
MDLKHLRYFIAVAEELHFGRAAARLFISQPALSFDIKKLEEQLDTQLFVRTNKFVKLTGAGETLLAEARNLLVQVEQMKALTKRSAAGFIGRVRIGFVNSMLHRGLPQAVERFQQSNPGVEVVLIEMNSAEQMTAIQRGQIDLGFVHGGMTSPGVASELVIADPFVCCVPASHPAAGRRKIDLADLRDEGFILFPRAVSPHYHDLIVARCVGAGFSPIIRHEARLWQTIVTMVSMGMGVALVPKTLSQAWPDNLYYAEIDQAGALSETHAIYPEAAPAVSRQAFLKTLREYLPTV